MHFLDAWTGLPAPALVGYLAPLAILVLAVFLPWRTMARAAAIGMAGALPFTPEALPVHLLGPWMFLWLGVAWTALPPPAKPERAARVGGFESAFVGMALGWTLLTLLLAAVARQDLADAPSRRASYGVALLALGLLHLMLRRDAARAGVAFATLGFGLQVLDALARDSAIGLGRDHGMLALATALAVGLVVRIARARRESAGTAWVSAAHDLHD